MEQPIGGLEGGLGWVGCANDTRVRIFVSKRRSTMGILLVDGTEAETLLMRFVKALTTSKEIQSQGHFGCKIKLKPFSIYLLAVSIPKR